MIRFSFEINFFIRSTNRELVSSKAIMESTTQHGWAESRPEYAGEGVSLQRAMVKIPWYRPIMREDYRADERTLEVAATIQAQDQGLWAQSRPEFSGGVIRPLVRVPRYPHVKWKFSTPRDPAYQKMAKRLALQVGPALTTSIDIL